jgi:alcohol dehydrogenase class IV
MPRFDFFNTPRILFGRGRITEIGTLAQSFGARTLLVYNGDTPGAGGPVDRVTDTLRSAPVEVHPIRQRGEPQVSDVERAVAAARETGCDVVVGLGGGSAIDCAKAVAGVLANGGSPLDYMEVIGRGRPLTKPATPWIAVPTTAGTGAEVTRNAVVGEPARKFKASLRSELLLPRVALVDPELGALVPPAVTAASGMDALCQLIESYTSTGSQPMTDALALRGIELAARALPRAYRDGVDLDAREDMALAAILSGITLTNAGLGAVHGFAAPLGANFPVPHGVVCAALLPHVMRANVDALRGQSANHPVLERYATVGRLLSERQGPAADAGIEAAEALARALNIPRLGTYGLTDSDVLAMAVLAKRASSMRFNPVILSDAALADVLRAAL